MSTIKNSKSVQRGEEKKVDCFERWWYVISLECLLLKKEWNQLMEYCGENDPRI